MAQQQQCLLSASPHQKPPWYALGKVTTNSPAAWVAEYTGTPCWRSTRGDTMDSSWKSRSGCARGRERARWGRERAGGAGKGRRQQITEHELQHRLQLEEHPWTVPKRDTSYAGPHAHVAGLLQGESPPWDARPRACLPGPAGVHHPAPELLPGLQAPFGRPPQTWRPPRRAPHTCHKQRAEECDDMSQVREQAKRRGRQVRPAAAAGAPGERQPRQRDSPLLGRAPVVVVDAVEHVVLHVPAEGGEAHAHVHPRHRHACRQQRAGVGGSRWRGSRQHSGSRVADKLGALFAAAGLPPQRGWLTGNVAVQHTQQRGMAPGLARQHAEVPGIGGVGAVTARDAGRPNTAVHWRFYPASRLRV